VARSDANWSAYNDCKREFVAVVVDDAAVVDDVVVCFVDDVFSARGRFAWPLALDGTLRFVPLIVDECSKPATFYCSVVASAHC
jgi:hypothetical protein